MKCKKWTKEEDNILEKHYPTQTKDFLLKVLNRNWEALRKRASCLGIKRKSYVEKWNKKELQILKSCYANSTWDSLLLHLPNRNKKAIREKARELKIRRKLIYKINANCNYKFFDFWSPEMAYILGFTYADGCILKDYSLKIGISMKDEDLLKNIKSFVAPEKKLYYDYERDMVTIAAHSAYMYNRLLKLGLTERKSLTTKFPNVPEKYLSHFIRGYFDGDGSIHYSIRKNRNKHKEWSSGFIGSKDFLFSMSEILTKQCGTRPRNVIKRSYSDIYDISYSVKDSIKLGQFIYKDSTIHLERKHKLFQQFLKEKIVED